jgi:hypothetical protein
LGRERERERRRNGREREGEEWKTGEYGEWKGERMREACWEEGVERERCRQHPIPKCLW